MGKELLKTNKKYYIVDLGLRNFVLPKRKYDLGFSIENIVYFELLRREFRVNIGKFGENEVDFVARKNDEIKYFQVTADMTAESTFNRDEVFTYVYGILANSNTLTVTGEVSLQNSIRLAFPEFYIGLTISLVMVIAYFAIDK